MDPLSPRPYRLEFCTQDVTTALTKAHLVDQIEFCADLKQDGLTPPVLEVAQLLNQLKIPLKVMIRHRFGDFQYDPRELEIMIDQASEFQAMGVSRYVFGATKQDRLDIPAITKFCESVFPSNVCIHKAIDQSSEILKDLQELFSIPNVNEVLTSGGSKTAWEGAEMISQMMKLSSSRLEIIAAGSITSQNLALCHETIQASIYHGKRIVDT